MQTRLNRLVEKGVVSRTAERPAHYASAIAPEDVSAGISICCWSVSATAAWFPSSRTSCADRMLSAEEIAELKQLIADAEQSGQRPVPRWQDRHHHAQAGGDTMITNEELLFNLARTTLALAIAVMLTALLLHSSGDIASRASRRMHFGSGSGLVVFAMARACAVVRNAGADG